MLTAKRAREINLLIAATQKAFQKYNPSSNCNKSNYVGRNGKANIHVSNGKVRSAAYLGSTCSRGASRRIEQWNIGGISDL